jgi:hypothetical protein
VATIETTDISMAAFFSVRGLKLSGLRLNRNQTTSIDCTFVFDGGPEVDALVMEYPGSSEAKYDSSLRALRKACTEMRQRERDLRSSSRMNANVGRR